MCVGGRFFPTPLRRGLARGLVRGCVRGLSVSLFPVHGAVGVGIAGIFIETHPDPANALSDGPNSLPLDNLKPALEQLLAIDKIVKR